MLQSLIGPDCEMFIVSLVQELDISARKAASVRRELPDAVQSFFGKPKLSFQNKANVLFIALAIAPLNERLFYVKCLFRFLIEHAAKIYVTQSSLDRFRGIFEQKCDEFGFDLDCPELMNYYKLKFPKRRYV